MQAIMLAQSVSVALTASVKATDTKSVSSFNHFLYLFGCQKSRGVGNYTSEFMPLCLCDQLKFIIPSKFQVSDTFETVEAFSNSLRLSLEQSPFDFLLTHSSIWI